MMDEMIPLYLRNHDHQWIYIVGTGAVGTYQCALCGQVR